MTEWYNLSPGDTIKETDVGRIKINGCWTWKKVPAEHVGMKAINVIYEVRRKIEVENTTMIIEETIEELRGILQAYFVFEDSVCVDYHQPHEAGEYLQKLLKTLTEKNSGQSISEKSSKKPCSSIGKSSY